MSDLSVLNHEVNTSYSLNENQLFEKLARTDFNENEIQILGSDIRQFGLITDWIERGKALFLKFWDEAKGIICDIYKEDIAIEDGLNLVKYIVGKLIQALTLTANIAVIIVTIAVKRGLDKICTTPEMRAF